MNKSIKINVFLLLLLNVAIIVFIFSSCVTEKQRAKICNSCAVKEFKKDSIIEKIVTIPIPIKGEPGPIQYLENPCKNLCDSLGRLKPFILNKSKNGVNQNIKTIGNSIVIASDKKDTTLNIPVKQKETFHNESKSEVKYVKCDLEHRTKFDGFTFWWFWITALLLFFLGVKKRFFI
jgi:hypothetical protein